MRPRPPCLSYPLRAERIETATTTEILRRPCRTTNSNDSDKKTDTPQPPSQTREVPKELVQPVFISDESIDDRTKKARKPRKKSKKSKKPITEEPLGESKPVSITMIGAGAYRSLTQKNDGRTFSITPCQIDQMLESLNQQATDSSALYAIDPATIEKTSAKLPEYHEFLDIFDRSKADELPPRRSYDHKIELEREGQPRRVGCTLCPGQG